MTELLNWSEGNISWKDEPNKVQKWYGPREAEDTKKRKQKYTKELYIKGLYDPDPIMVWSLTKSHKSWSITSRGPSVQFSSFAQSCPTLCDPMKCSTPGLPVHHQLLEFNQTHVYRVSDAIKPSHPLSSPSPPAPNPSQHQSLFQWVKSSHEVDKVLELQR